MEGLFTDLDRNGTNLENATSIRLKTRPPGKAVIFEAFESTLRPSSSTKNGAYGAKRSSQSSSQTRSGNGKFKPAVDPGSKSSTTRPTSRGPVGSTSRSTSGSGRPGTQEAKCLTVKKPQFKTFTGYADSQEEVSSSEDEMDLFSSQPHYSDDANGAHRYTKRHNRSNSTDRGGTSWPAGFDVDTPRPKAGQSSKRRGENKHAKEVDIDFTSENHQHSHDPVILDQKSRNLAKLKINKVKKADDVKVAPSSSSLAPSSSFGASRPSNPPSKENGSSQSYKAKFIDSSLRSRDDEVILSEIRISPLSAKSANSNRRRSPSPPPRPSQPPSRSTTKPIPMAEVNVGLSKPRPKPRAISKSQRVGDLPSSQGSRSSTRPASSQIRSTMSVTNVLDMMPLDLSQGTSRPKSSQVRHRSRSRSRSPYASPEMEVRVVPQRFPTLSPTSSPARPAIPRPADFPMMSPLRETLEEESTGHKAKPPLSRKPCAFPMPSPQSKDRPEDSSAKTRPKPSRKGKEISLLSEEDEPPVVVKKSTTKVKVKETSITKERTSQDRTRRKLQAFPMSTQVLASIDSPSAPSGSRSPAGSTPSRKRASEDGSGDERASKKSRKFSSQYLRSPTRPPFEDEGDSICISPNVDPRTLCPYCDLPLPSSPSPLLLGILADIKKKSTGDPRPSNPLGLKAPLAIFIAACQRHRFESQILPEAERKGWPKTIDWKKLGGRITKMGRDLKALIEDPGDTPQEDGAESGVDDDWEVVYSRDKGKQKEKEGKSKKGPKARSIFWMEIITEIKAKGLRAVSGVRGQFTNFEKAQPGYYGELGSVIIHQTLYNMFPPSEMEPQLIAPLTANEFVQRILVPEVALRLIMEDRSLNGEGGLQDALTILRDSSAYGVAMFPEDGGEWGGGGRERDEADEKMGVGDLIVMERARKRRKELEEEEEEERRLAEAEKERKAAEVREKAAIEREMEARRKRRGKDKDEKASDPPPEANKPSRPRPRPIVKGSGGMNGVAPRESEDEARRPPPSRVRARSRSRSVASTRSRMDTDPASGIETSIEISDSDGDNPHRTTSEERRRSPSASKSRPAEGFSNPNSTRSTRRGIQKPSFNSPDSGTSTKAVVDSMGTRSRSSSRARIPKAQKREDSKMVVDDDDDDSDNFEPPGFLNTKTPFQKSKRAAVQVESDDENTPKAAPPRHTADDLSHLAPLLRARARLARQHDSQVPLEKIEPTSSRSTSKPSQPSRSGGLTKQLGPPVGKTSYSWLLSE